MNPPGGDIDRLLRRLAGHRALARYAILFERIWPAVWPALGVAGLFLCAALLDLPRLLPPWWHIGLLAITAVLVIGLLIRGLVGVVAPDDKAADRRLELASGQSHRPLSVLTDRPSRGRLGPDTAAAALWQVHVARAVRSVRRLRVGLPRPGLAKHDPRALRAALVLALFAALVIAGEEAPSRLAQAVEPTLPREAPSPATELQAWITPPAYTRLPPIFLRGEDDTVSVPVGSRLTVSVTGGDGTPALALDGHSEPFRALDKASFQVDHELSAGGHLAVRRNGGQLAAWDVAVIADQPPTAEWSDNPARAPGSQQTRLPWRAADDYGVVSLQAEMRLRDRQDAPPLVVNLPLPGGTPKTAHGTSQQDLTAHPWAGLPVIAKLVARDALNQAGESQAVEFVLPQRPFQNPVARALIAIRRDLSLRPNDRESAVNGLDALLMAPEAPLGGDYAAYMNLGAIYYLLERNKAPEAIDQAQQRMWELALHLEEGQTERTARALDEARQAARDALDKAIHEPNEANREALEKRLKELEEAIERHLQAMVEEARRNNDEMPFDPEAQRLTNRDLDKLAEQARQAAREGRMQDAQQRMAELERMLDKLRNARAEHGRDGERAESQRRRGRQQMGAVQDMIGRQGGLLDHTQSRVDETTRFRGNRTPTQPTDEAAQRNADQRVQQALRRALGELMQQFGDLTGQVPPSLSEADTAMRDAGRQLGMGNDAAAGDSEQKAIEALQKGGREMGQTMAKQFGQQGQDGSEQEGDSDGPMGLTLHDGRGDSPGRGWQQGPPERASPGRDPLGRRYGQGSSGADESADVTVPEERERQRTQAIQEELRRRGAERMRPQMELDYIDRLLKQF